MKSTKIQRDGKVICGNCGRFLGEVFRDPDGGEEPWWAEGADGEAAGFGPEPTRRQAVRLLTAFHECRSTSSGRVPA